MIHQTRSIPNLLRVHVMFLGKGLLGACDMVIGLEGLEFRPLGLMILGVFGFSGFRVYDFKRKVERKFDRTSLTKLHRTLNIEPNL